MLSDVLLKANQDIHAYLASYPETYREYRTELMVIYDAIAALRDKLDRAHEDGEGRR